MTDLVTLTSIYIDRGITQAAKIIDERDFLTWFAGGDFEKASRCISLAKLFCDSFETPGDLTQQNYSVFEFELPQQIVKLYQSFPNSPSDKWIVNEMMELLKRFQ